MMEVYGHLLGLLFGAMLIAWSIWMLWLHFHTVPEQRAYRRVRPWIPGILLLIGLADLTKALRDLWKDF
jgi:uncharacterized membrane protein YfcA